MLLMVVAVVAAAAKVAVVVAADLMIGRAFPIRPIAIIIYRKM